MTPFLAQVSIHCVDGMTEGIDGADPHRMLNFLKERDHEGAQVSMVVRDTPDTPFRIVDDSNQVYRELDEWSRATR